VIERKKVFFFWPSSLDTFLDSVKKEAQVCKDCWKKSNSDFCGGEWMERIKERWRLYVGKSVKA